MDIFKRKKGLVCSLKKKEKFGEYENYAVALSLLQSATATRCDSNKFQTRVDNNSNAYSNLFLFYLTYCFLFF